MKITEALVSCAWLAQHLESPDLVVLDASMTPPGQASGPEEDHAQLQIPGSRIFDLKKDFSERSSCLPNTMPGAEAFATSARGLGITSKSQIVVYERRGIYASPRAWWMFRAMGHCSVAVLDGGFPEWLRLSQPTEARPISKGAPSPGADSDFVAQPQKGAFCDAETIEQALAGTERAVLDARAPERFYARTQEPRAGMRSGHMPGAQNLPWMAVQEQGTMRSVEELQELFAAVAGAKRQLAFSCGSGITACVLALAADIAGYRELCVYDGSWSEWGAEDAPYPVVGPA